MHAKFNSFRAMISRSSPREIYLHESIDFGTGRHRFAPAGRPAGRLLSEQPGPRCTLRGIAGHLPAAREAPGGRRHHRAPRGPAVARQTRHRPAGAAGDHAGPPGCRAPGRLRGSRGAGRCSTAVLARIAGAGLCAGGAAGRHAGLPGLHAAAADAGRQCAQHQGVLQRQAGQIRHPRGPACGPSVKNSCNCVAQVVTGGADNPSTALPFRGPTCPPAVPVIPQRLRSPWPSWPPRPRPRPSISC
mmetsp:Transcript_59261/g.139854  ORF Transcript_59261/g.139854 Transcript_59261/m.139854 type:complete len:245 (-) Transcript_59261:3189-3923(-)